MVSDQSNEVQSAESAGPASRKKTRMTPVSFRGVTVRVYRKSKYFPYYRIAFRADGKRILRTFRTLDAAMSAAEAKARELYAGNYVGASLPKSAAMAYQFAVTKVNQLCMDMNMSKGDATVPDVHLTLEDVVTEYIEAKCKLGPGSLIEAVSGYLSKITEIRRVPLKQAIEQFFEERVARTRPEKEGVRPKLSPRFPYQERLRLMRLQGAFQMDVCDLGPEHLDLFFAEHLKDMAARTRNHFRSTLRVFFKWCVRKHYLPESHDLSKSDGLRPDGKGKEAADVSEVQIYSAKEIAALLANAKGPVQALLAISAFAGMRTEELLRLEWSDVWRRPGYIEVTGRKAKTRSRRLVPIGVALAAWLEPFRQCTEGLIWPGRFVSFHEHMREVHAKAQVPRRANALRHSFITFRLADVHNEHQVAAEAGTSPMMIHKHYRELTTEADAKAWFNVLPATTAPIADSVDPSTVAT